MQMSQDKLVRANCSADLIDNARPFLSYLKMFNIKDVSKLLVCKYS